MRIRIDKYLSLIYKFVGNLELLLLSNLFDDKFVCVKNLNTVN